MNETKFNQKGSVYAKGRPGYPNVIFEYLRSTGVIDKCKTVADFGSGTGIFSLQISQFADVVYAIEPNDDMRQIAEREFCNHSNIVSVNATAENSLLADKSVDLITVAQAFHWFDRSAFKNECQRILKPGGKVFLVWNDRDTSNDIIIENFAVNKKYCPNFKGSSNGINFSKEGFADFFDGDFEIIEFENSIRYTKNKFIERNLSSSYAPMKQYAQYIEYIKALEVIFEKYQDKGELYYPYITRCYIGEVSSNS